MELLLKDLSKIRSRGVELLLKDLNKGVQLLLKDLNQDLF